MRPGRRHRDRGLQFVLASSAALALAATATHAQEPRGHGAQKLMGLNVDLFSAATGETDADIGYLPQVWLGFGGDRMTFVDDQVVLPNGVVMAIEWFRGPGQDPYTMMGDDPMGGDLDPQRVGSHFAMWQRRFAYNGVIKLVARDVEPLHVRCGYHWRLPLDFNSAPWINVVLTPRHTALIAFDASAPILGDALMEVLWFPCAR